MSLKHTSPNLDRTPTVLAAALLASWSVVAFAGQRAVPARVLQSDATRARFVVDVPTPNFTPSAALPGFERVAVDGFDATGKPGEPSVVSRRYFVALPPTGTYAVSARVLASEALGTHRLEPAPTPVLIDGPDEMGPVTGERVDWDEATYRGWVAPDVVEPEEPAFIRRQRVLAIAVNPFFYDASTHELVVATKIEIDVRIDGGRSADAAPRAAPEADGWNEVFGRLFVNANVAGAWRAPKRERAAAAELARMAAPGAVKIRVRDTGVHKVSATTLLAAGFPAGQPVGNLRLYRRTYSETTLTPGETEVPVYVREGAGGTAGIFDASDIVVFYGLRVREDAVQGDAREQYSSINIYWLEPGAGTGMATRTPAPGFVTADTTNASFSAVAHFETDTYFRDATPTFMNDVYYFNTGREAGPTDMPFTVGAIRPGGGLVISAELHGQRYNGIETRAIRLSLVNSIGETELAPAYSIDEKNRQVFVSALIPAAQVAVGTNQFRMTRPASPARSQTEVLINFLDITYGALYRARGNTLRFNTATLAGDTSVTVTGLSTTADFELFDITVPATPVRCVVGAGHFTAVPGGFAFSYRENIPPTPDRQFILLPVSRMVDVAADDVILDTPSTIIGGAAEAGVDVLVVAHASYLAQMQTWVSYRRAQGYRVLLVDVDDVFDEFNGGVFHARAIQRFARHFFENADASALVLVGDASEDHKLIHSDSGPNFVPTFTRVDDVPGIGDEVVTMDKRFVKLPGPGGGVDHYPDMIVGRLPVGTTVELDIVLAKVFDFESPDASEFWRKRMIIVADDEYSEGSSAFASANRYCYHGEVGFQTGQETVAQIIENSLPAGYDVIRFYLKDYTSSFYPCSNPCNINDCALATAAWSHVRQGATEVLMNELNQGATLVTIQSHMNRATVTHERLLSTESGTLLGGTGRDHLRMANRGRPWIIFGMGCHFSDYAVFRERSDLWSLSSLPNGDAFAEQLLFQNDRGAVGTYGSSGFEFLNENRAYMNMMAKVWFYEAPYDTMLNQTQAEWKFGQLMFLVEARVATPPPADQVTAVDRYHILGDPLLRIDAGPPAFDVTVDGRPVTTGEDVTSRGVSDTLQVVAVVTDENAIRDFALEIGGVDVSDSLTITALTDPTLPRARQYRLSFEHVLRPENYDIVLRAYQSPDTLAGTYHMAAEFVLRVESTIEVSVNGRVVASGGAVPSLGNYRVDLSFPVFVPGSEIDVFMDDVPVVPFNLNHPAPEDSLAWIITFQKSLAAGQHTLRIAAGPTIEFIHQVVVSSESGLQDVVNYPNPFRDAGTNFLFSNEVEITDGSIDVYTSSGKRVRTLEIPPSSRLPGHNSVFWDGRDAAGDALANGTYLYVIKVQQRSGSATVRGKISKLN